MEQNQLHFNDSRPITHMSFCSQDLRKLLIEFACKTYFSTAILWSIDKLLAGTPHMTRCHDKMDGWDGLHCLTCFTIIKSKLTEDYQWSFNYQHYYQTIVVLNDSSERNFVLFCNDCTNVKNREETWGHIIIWFSLIRLIGWDGSFHYLLLAINVL